MKNKPSGRATARMAKLRHLMTVREDPFMVVMAFLSEAEMLQYIGPRCPDVEPECCACAAWARFDMRKAVDITVERKSFIKYLLTH